MNGWLEDVKKALSLLKWQRLLRKRDSKRTPARLLMTGVMGLLMLFSLGSASVGPLFAMRGQQSAMDGFVVLVSVLAGAFILYIQLIVSYQRMIVEDSSILLVAPLSGRTILLFRLFESMQTVMLFGLLGLPLIGVYLWLSGAAVAAYPLAVIALWLMTWLLAALALLLMAVVIRAIKRPIGRDILGVISSIVAVLILLGTRLMTRDITGASHAGGVQNLFANWLSPGFLYVPLSWFGHSLIGFGHHFGMGLAYLVLILVGVFLAVDLSIVICAPVLHERLTQLSDVATTGRRGRRKRPGRGQPSAEPEPVAVGRAPRAAVPASPAMAVAKTRGSDFKLIWQITLKDLLRLRRTPVDLANYLFPTAYLLYFTTQPTSQSDGLGYVFGLLPVFILILASTMGRVPISSFGTEGEQVWLYLQAPTPSNAVLWAKWLFGTLPTLVWWEILCVLLTLFHALPTTLAWILAVSGIWLIPGAVALTLPFAVHGAAFIPRLVGRRNRYVNRRSSWYILVIFPYLLLQIIPLGVVSLILTPPIGLSGRLGAWFAQLQSMSWLVGVGLLVSVLLALLGTVIGRSMGLEAWRNKRIELYETGSLDGNG